ncbi:MAG TPA: alanine/ornithine racemase family PLP-dependent enzyme [Hyphomicrobiaceae bacterium]|nr:alanine/ornithine racemase family PLP-dependent enzyme [Hyphomicrobiaceae bacterium]
MITPRLEINLDKIFHNASTLVRRLKARGISITGVTKACMGEPRVAKTLLAAGVRTLGDSRIENIARMRRAGITAPIALIRSPMLSQTDQIVELADSSHNTELDVISALSLSAGAAGRRHAVVLMVELGDLREGILAKDLEAVARRTLKFPHIDFCGIGANLACLNGVAPNEENMRELSSMADQLDRTFRSATGWIPQVVSGGNSSNLNWALNGRGIHRINNLRLGESILMGIDPLQQTQIDGLYTDAVTLFAEVIESKRKPRAPRGQLQQSPFQLGSKLPHKCPVDQAILAIGHQDVDTDGLTAPSWVKVIGATSDHLVVSANSQPVAVGSEMAFGLDYSGLVRAMTSPYVTKLFRGRQNANHFESRVPATSRYKDAHNAVWHSQTTLSSAQKRSSDVGNKFESEKYKTRLGDINIA